MDLTERARVLAAIADPRRLQVLDLLSTGDASPGELRAELGVASNLLAHHLAVLEDCGLVSRHRSHADRRRTYLRLRGETLAGLLPEMARRADIGRVVFVCTANSARSQLADALWRRASSIPSTSAGTHPADRVAPGARAAARRHGLSLVTEPQSLDDVLRSGDYVVTVCDAAHEELGPTGEDAGGVQLAGTAHWSVDDPVAVGTDAAFDRACAELADRVAQLAPRLVPSASAS